MNLEHAQIIPLLKELVAMTPTQQEIFLFCLENLPEPKPYTGDLLRIRTAVGCNPRTAQVALWIISRSKILSKFVSYRRINRKEINIYELQQAQDHLFAAGRDIH
jgi:hypothetical protein